VTLRTILRFPDHRLRANAERAVVFDEDLCSLATDLSDTLRAASGIGGCATGRNAFPLFLSRVIGYAGNATVGQDGITNLSATSVAQSKGAYHNCILALSGSAGLILMSPCV
jgi:hypothetical protein